MLEEHKNREHVQHRHGNKAVQPVTNLLLFNVFKDEEFDWDGIGKDFSQELTTTEVFEELRNYQHHDGFIDIRMFYPELTKDSEKMSLDSIRNKYVEQLEKRNSDVKEIHFNSVPLFCPL
jgi:hypothetical protein